MRDRLILLGVIFILGVLAGPARTHAKPVSEPNQEEIRKIESRLSTERENLRKLDSQEKDLLAQLARLEQEVAEKKTAVNDLSQKIRRANTEVTALKRNLTDLKKLSMAAQNKISRKLVELYKHARIGYVNALADVMDINDLLRRIRYLGAVMAEDRAALIRAAEQAQSRQEAISKAEARLIQTQDINRQEEARLISLKKELEEKVVLLVNIHKEKEFYETSVQELETAAEGLKQTLIDIEKKDAYETNRPCHFEDFKGKLPYPMRGKLLKGKSSPYLAAFGTYKGIVIEGPTGSEVTAVFPGKVAFSGRLKGYGEIVIINHGARFFTVSAHLSSRKKIEGEVVKKGEVIGQVDGSGVSRKGTLYFEIRRAGKGLSPLKWLTPDHVYDPKQTDTAKE